VKRQQLGILLHDLSLGGTERIGLRLAGEWARRGRDVSIFCGDPTGALHDQLPIGVSLISPARPIGRGWRSRQRVGAWAATACREKNVEGLFVPGNFHVAALPALRGAQVPGMVVVCKLSNPVKRSDRGAMAQQYSQRRMAKRLRNADAVVAMSPALAEEANQILGELPLRTIEEPILDGDPDGNELTAERRGIVASGRFVLQKDFALAVKTLAHLADQEAELTIVGDGPLLGEVRDLVTAAKLYSRVHLPGRMGDVGPWFRRSRVLLLTSRYEGFPAVAVEALAAGARIVATDCSPAIHEIVNSSEFGEVVRSRKPHDLAAAIDRQLQQKPVPSAAIAALHHRFGLARSAQRYLDLFDSL